MFQQGIPSRQAAGIAGEFATQSPRLVAPFVPANFAPDTPRIVGRFYTFNAAGLVVLGVAAGLAPDEVAIAGLLVSPKEYTGPGNGLGADFIDNGAEAPELGRVRDDIPVQLCVQGEPWVNTPAALVGQVLTGREVLAVEKTTGIVGAYLPDDVPADTHWVIPRARVWRTNQTVAGIPMTGGSANRVFIAQLNG